MPGSVASKGVTWNRVAGIPYAATRRQFASACCISDSPVQDESVEQPCSAYAADGDGQSTLFTSVAQQQQHSLAVGAQSPPLFTSGGVGVRVWAPMAPSYNAAANGDLAARDIWGQG